ncbi:hypothetical protein FQN49_006442 [Arthroderma sp. PD_2]|nr:hypothetical protein FQN49_006442 [Arthroderma sp. PD_2]
MPFTDSELHVLDITERVSSTLSLLGCIFVIVTFLCSHRFRTPVNRLIFFATLGNILGIGATLTSRSGILAGQDSRLCQWQAFFIQWFHPADALWAFCMACNVYLTLFRRYRNESKGKVYGNATLWCWIRPEWSLLRVAGVYGPIWLIVLMTLAIYIYSAKYILASRRNIQRLGNIGLTMTHTSEVDSHYSTSAGMTDISSSIEHDAHPGPQHDSQQDAQRGVQQEYNLGNWAEYHQQEHLGDDLGPTYFPPATPRRTTHGPDSAAVDYEADVENAPGNPDVHMTPGGRRPSARDNFRMRKASWERQSAAWAYSKFALLFFCSLLITWLPATINRVYSFAHPKQPSHPVTYMASLVLPLQGFWNTLVYTAVSYSAITSLLASFRQNPRRFFHFPDLHLGRLYSFIPRTFRHEA